MKIQTIIIVITGIILLAGCCKKSESLAISPQASLSAPLGDIPPQQIATRPECLCIARADANTNDTHDVRLVVTEIWKGQGVDKGFQLPSLPSNGGVFAEGAVVFFIRADPTSKFQIYPIYAGQVGGMTVDKFKTSLGL